MIITIEGVDWDTHAVTASGSATATVVAQKMSEASLTLTRRERRGDGGRIDAAHRAAT